MTIILVGDTNGQSDEGMKIVSRKLSAVFNKAGLHSSVWNSVQLIKGFRKLKNISVIHFTAGPTYKTLFIAWIVSVLNLFRHKTIISFIHPKRSKMLSLLMRFVKIDGVTVHSEDWHNELKTLFSGTYYLGPLMGFDDKKFAIGDEREASRLRVKLGISPTEKIALHVGHLNRGRNLQALITFSVKFNYRLVIVASSTVEADLYLKAELQNAGAVVIDEYIENIEKIYQGSDVYLFPTLDEDYCIQIPLSVLEASACNIPVISTRFGGLPWYFNEDQIYFVNRIDEFEFEPGLLKTPDQDYLNEFTWEQISKQLLTYYRELGANL